MPKTAFPVITVSGDAATCGFEYGEKCRELIHLSLESYKKAFQEDLKIGWEEALNLGKKFLPAIEKYDPSAITEMHGLAKGARRSFDEILVLHVKTELKLAASIGGFDCCTTICATPEATFHQSGLIGKNWDWTIASQKLGVILRKKRSDAPSTISLTEAGLIGRDGFNSAGIAVVANALISDNWHIGVPLHIVIQKALRASSMNDAMASILSSDRASSNNYMILHKDGEAVCLEAAPSEYNILWAEGGILAHSNHFTIPNPKIKDLYPAIYPNTFTRYHRARKLINNERRNITVDTFKRILTDHFDYPYSICWHPNPEVKSDNQVQTNASMIFEIEHRKAHIAMGPPCQNEYIEIDCNDIMQ